MNSDSIYSFVLAFRPWTSFDPERNIAKVIDAEMENNFELFVEIIKI